VSARPELLKEFKRKAFHCLSLLYLAAYHRFGARTTLTLMAVWILLEGCVEWVRLRYPRVNGTLMRLVGNIHRPDEEHRVSGILWTTLGCWLTLFLFGDRPMVVSAAILYLALGDGAAALVGRAWGRTQIGFGGRRKTLEGSLGCFAACLAAGWAVGLRGVPLAAGAAVATLLELVPLPLDDNLWLPLLSAAVLSSF